MISEEGYWLQKQASMPQRLASMQQLKDVTIYDIRGSVLVAKTSINATETRINVGTTNQILLVQVTTIDGFTATKKVVN